jgi:hypothetical protein
MAASESVFLKGSCDHCGGHIEFPLESSNKIVFCPHCKLPTTLPGPPNPSTSPLPLPFDLWIPAKTQASKTELITYGHIEPKIEFFGWGAFVQLLGICVLWWFPLGTIIGIILVGVGHVLSKKTLCSRCGTIIANKDSKLCPICQCHFIERQPASWWPAWAVGTTIVLLLGVATFILVYPSAKTASAESAARSLEALNYNLQKSDFFPWIIEGVLTNHSAKPFSSVRIDFTLYDQMGTEVEITSDYTEYLAPHGSWKFQAAAFVEKARAAKVRKITPGGDPNEQQARLKLR